mmetsp:Transcript_65008/g.155260  ORF Transcript_65008/g.155260 Transcript_65008/m.155260 type:complete len:224 (-) Transcript_65008:173-844(-)
MVTPQAATAAGPEIRLMHLHDARWRRQGGGTLSAPSPHSPPSQARAQWTQSTTPSMPRRCCTVWPQLALTSLMYFPVCPQQLWLMRALPHVHRREPSSPMSSPQSLLACTPATFPKTARRACAATTPLLLSSMSLWDSQSASLTETRSTIWMVTSERHCFFECCTPSQSLAAERTSKSTMSSSSRYRCPPSPPRSHPARRWKQPGWLWKGASALQMGDLARAL